MKTMGWLWTGVLAGVLVANGAAASSKRGVVTQITNNIGRAWRPIGREFGRLGRYADRGRMYRSDRWVDRDGSRSSGHSRSVAGRRTGTPFEWSSAIAAGKAIEIKGVNGKISATAASGREVEVRATKRAHKSDPDEVTIEVIEHEDGVTICAKYPSVRGKENECGPGDEGHMSTHDNDVEVEFEVRVPAGVRLVAHTVNGGIEASDLRGPVDAETVNGEVEVSTSGYASAQTVNGSIVVSMGMTAWREPLSFGTVNGEIRITVPAGLDADVRAETMNGSIHTDFPVTVQGRFNRRHLKGAIGKGGQRLELETLNGSIALRSAS